MLQQWPLSLINMKNIQPFALTIFLSLLFNSVVAQDEASSKKLTLVDEVQNLQLDSIISGYTAYYSSGFQSRAQYLEQLIFNSNNFFKQSLGIDILLKIALLDTIDYSKISSSQATPYGFPFVEDTENGMITILPAHTEYGAVYSAYLESFQSPSDKAISNLKKIGHNPETSIPIMVDLVALHEIGHMQAYAFEIHNKQPWFNEFIASYFGYAYMRRMEPEMAIIWDNVTFTGYKNYTPNHDSLEEFNELYFGVGGEDYVWFQNAFQVRIKEVYDSMGTEFIKKVQGIWTKDFEPQSAKDLLEELDKVTPGFSDWADRIKKDYKH